MNNNVVVNRLICIPAEQYNTPYKRPFEMCVTENDMGYIADVFQRADVSSGNIIPVTTIANKLSGIIKPTGNTIGGVAIPNGWSAPRLRYLLNVYVDTPNGRLQYYIQGYSEHYDPSYTGNIDPNAKFYINSITTISEVKNPITNEIVSNILGTYNVVGDHDTAQTTYEYDGSHSTETMVRPLDIMNELKFNSRFSEATNNISNNIGVINGHVNVTSRSNSDPTKFFGKTMDSFIKAKSLSMGGYDPSDVFTTAADILSEPDIIDCVFIRKLYELTNNPNLSAFTLNELSMLDPSTPSKLEITIPPPMYGNDVGGDLLNPRPELMAAVSLSNSVTSLMCDNMITVLNVSMTNSTGVPVATVTNFDGFVNNDRINTTNINRILTTLEHVVFPNITHGNGVLMTIHCDIDILKDICVTITIEQNPTEIIRMPLFADASNSPTVSNRNTKLHLTESFSALIDETYVSDDYSYHQ